VILSIEWRLDGGEWKKVTPEELTSDLYQLGILDFTAGRSTK